MDEYVARRGLWVVMVLVLVGLLWLLAPVLTPVRRLGPAGLAG